MSIWNCPAHGLVGPGPCCRDARFYASPTAANTQVVAGETNPSDLVTERDMMDVLHVAELSARRDNHLKEADALKAVSIALPTMIEEIQNLRTTVTALESRCATLEADRDSLADTMERVSDALFSGTRNVPMETEAECYLHGLIEQAVGRLSDAASSPTTKTDG